MSRNRVLLVGVLFFALILLLLYLSGREKNRSEGQEAGTVTVTRGDLAAVVEATGRVEASRSAQLSFPISGQIDTILVGEGEEVVEGAPLLTLERDEMELRLEEARAALAIALANRAKAEAPASAAEVAAAQAAMEAARLALTVAENELDALPEEERAESEEAVEVAEAQAALERARAAFRAATGAPSPQEQALLDAHVEQATVRLRQVETALQSATLRAPFDGMVVALLASEGERAAAGQQVLRLADPASMVVIADVDEVDVGLVEVGQPVSITLDAFPTRPFPGEVTRIAPVADSPRGATTYRTVVEYRESSLPIRLGMAADLEIYAARAVDTLLLPLSAIRYAETQPYVVVRRGGETVEQEVVLGAQDGRMVAILEGVEEGETVLLP